MDIAEGYVKINKPKEFMDLFKRNYGWSLYFTEILLNYDKELSLELLHKMPNPWLPDKIEYICNLISWKRKYVKKNDIIFELLSLANKLVEEIHYKNDPAWHQRIQGLTIIAEYYANMKIYLFETKLLTNYKLRKKSENL